MAGTRTAPDPSAVAANKVITTLHLMDASGDMFTDAVVSAAAPTSAEVQAWAVAYQAASQSTLYAISSLSEWSGASDPANAESDQRSSVKQGVNILYKNPTTLKAQTPRLAAPIPGVMQANNDIPVIGSAEFAALLVAINAILTGSSFQHAQYTERRERSNNPRVLS